MVIIATLYIILIIIHSMVWKCENWEKEGIFTCTGVILLNFNSFKVCKIGFESPKPAHSDFILTTLEV